LNATSKFSVLDFPGLTQPKPDVSSPSPTSGGTTTAGGTGGAQGRRATSSSGPLIKSEGQNLIGTGCFEGRTKNPSWIADRANFYDVLKQRRDAEFSSKIPAAIEVILPDGKKVEGCEGWVTTPYEVARKISQGLADSSIVARVKYSDFLPDYDAVEDGMAGVDIMAEEMEDGGVETKESTKLGPYLWDMNRVLVGSVSKLEFLKFDDTDAKTVFWHSSAHMLGEALEHSFGSKLTIGPPLSGGFYYDCYMGEGNFNLKEEDYKVVEAEVSKITKQKQKFERLVLTKEEGLELFASNPFKLSIFNTKVGDGERTTVYRCGDLIDLCRGPHVQHTGKVKAFACSRHSATCWLGETSNDSLQRMYGISFPDKKMLKVWKENQEKAKERDHRRIANAQQLVMFHELSPGSAFWLPHGTRIYQKLMNYIRDHYWKRGYDEIITPNIYNLDLWHQSGHALHYKDAMFCFPVENQEFALKPMNCPGHCLMFANSIRSYRDLPMRFADFGVLHRNELSGALTGLTRVRRFQQDDAHIYCREDQIESEVLGSLEFMKEVYTHFGMTYKLELSTRPKKALGEIDMWNKAEKALANAMNEFAGVGNWKVNPEDGAFYGPKIDIKVMDAMERIHQCATIQLDFQLPIRFNLQYSTGSKVKGEEFTRPVMVHRAMLGSVERMFAVLCEHYGGKWPLWLSPRQFMIVPIHADYNGYCEKVRKVLHDAKFYVDVDLSKEKFNKKVRSAQIMQYNFQLVIGEAETTNETVNIRTRDNKIEGEVKLSDLVAKFAALRDEFK